jgi:hypothetical protein
MAVDETKRTPSRPPASAPRGPSTAVPVPPAPEPVVVKPRPAWQIVALAGAGALTAGLALFGLVKLFG